MEVGPKVQNLSAIRCIGFDIKDECAVVGGRGLMTERKMAFRRVPERPDLEKLYELSRNHEMTDGELKVQQASFVYGNAPEGSGITKESAMESVDRMRLKPPPS